MLHSKGLYFPYRSKSFHKITQFLYNLVSCQYTKHIYLNTTVLIQDDAFLFFTVWFSHGQNSSADLELLAYTLAGATALDFSREIFPLTIAHFIPPPKKRNFNMTPGIKSYLNISLISLHNKDNKSETNTQKFCPVWNWVWRNTKLESPKGHPATRLQRATVQWKWLHFANLNFKLQKKRNYMIIFTILEPMTKYISTTCPDLLCFVSAYICLNTTFFH